MEAHDGTETLRSLPEAGSRHAADDSGWLERVAELASQDAGGVATDLLGDYLPMLAEAATSGRFPGAPRSTRCDSRAGAPQSRELPPVEESTCTSPRRGGCGASCPLSSWNATGTLCGRRPPLCCRSWTTPSRHSPRATRKLVANACRREETVRRELVEDLLRGDAHLSELVERAEPFGLDLTRAHQVALAEPRRRLSSIAAATTALERVVLDRFGDRDVLVATKDGRVVVLALGDATGAPSTSGRLNATSDLGKIVHGELNRLRRGSPWRVAVGRAHPGAYGIARSYEEAREGLTMATRMDLGGPIIEMRDVLTYRVLARDQPALVDLVYSVLDPLREARGGAEPLVETLAAYFDSGCVATATAARLHLSVRAVTYRLGRVKSLTGFDPLDPAHRFTLQVAVLGARLLGWPEQSIADAD